MGYPRYRAILTSVVILAMIPAPAMAQTASGFGSLIGMRGSSLENEMSNRGYSFAKNVGSAQMWWNSSSRKCVSVAIDNGRVDSIQNASASDCGHTANGSGGDTAAAVVAGAAIIGLAAALSSHHDKNQGHSQTSNHDSEYSRGYNDGLYGAQYSNNDDEAYHSGFLAGEAEATNRRAANTPYARSLPASARSACEQKGDEFQGMPAGTSVVTSFTRLSNGNFDAVVAAGHYQSRCEVTTEGRVIEMNPY